jgi:hypothetical protein
MKNKPKFKVNPIEKKLYFNGNSINLDESLYETKILDSNNGIRLNYNKEEGIDLFNEYLRIIRFLRDNKLEKTLRIFKYEFPEKAILITKAEF